MKEEVFKGVNELRKIWSAFRQSRVLITANNYRIFDYLSSYQSAQAISKKLQSDIRATEILLDALTGMGLLKKQGRRYRNSPIASTFLITGKPYYQGDIIRHADNLWKNWSGLDEIIKTGKPHRKSRDHDAFVLGMHNIAALKAGDVISRIDLKGVKRALDLGGGPGTYAIEIAKQGIDVTLFDYPETIEIAKRIISNENIKNIHFLKGDFIADDIGKGYDLIFISQVMHAYSEKDNFQFLKKCKRALKDTGRIVIQEFYISDDRTQPMPGALFSVNMLVNTEGGRCYAPVEIKRWLSKTGFRRIQERLIEDTVLITGEYIL